MHKPIKLTLKDFISYEDVTYHFKDGKVVLVVGDNHDDASQQGNGSGKSGLLEAFSFAIKGTSIRDVKIKELVRNGAEKASVLLQLHNTRTNQVIEIERTIYSSSKSGEYEMWIDSEPMTDRYSDANMFNAYVFDVLGISKEDFDAFFLITSSNYTPFLKVGDSKKKDIINRFSGANKIDAATPLIEADIKAVDIEIRVLQDSIISQKAKIGVWEEEIATIEAEPTNEDHVKEYQQELDELDLQFADKEVELKQIQREWGEVGFEKATFIETKYDELIARELEEIEIAEEAIATARKDMMNVSKRFDIETLRKDIERREEENKKELKEWSESLTEYTLIRDELKTQSLAAISCPKCKHVFNVQDKDFDAKEVKKMIKQIESEDIPNAKEAISLLHEMAKEFQVERDALNKKIQDEQEEFKNLISELQQKVVEFNDTLSSLRKKKAQQDFDKKQLELKYKNLETQKDSLAAQIQALHSQKVQIERNIELALDVVDGQADKAKRIKVIQEKIDTTNATLSKLEASLQEELNKKVEKEKWITNFKNFKSHLANKSIKNISDYTNLYLQSMGSNLSISIEGYKTVNKKLKEEINTQVLRNGFDQGSYGKFSAGERGRIDISVILALQELINLNSPTGGLDFLACDEILDSMDSLGLESIVKALDSVGKTIMIISQNTINSLQEQTLTIRKQNGISTIC